MSVERPTESPMGKPRRSAGLPLTILAASAIVVFASVATRAGSREGTVAASVSPRGPSPLPSGAPAASEEARYSPDEGCSFADPGFGDYGGWRPLPLGKLLIAPDSVSASGSYDLLLHFHGAEPARKELVPLKLGMVVYALDAGPSSRFYERHFTDPSAFPSLLEAINRAVAQASGVKDAHPGHITVSSWSAGSGATRQIVREHGQQIGGLVLLDSLYGGYNGAKHELEPGQLPAIVGYARRALEGGPPLWLSYSEVPTEGYASSGQTATFLLSEVGEKMNVLGDLGDPRGLKEQLSKGHLTVRGYGGSDKAAHCEHLRLLGPALKRLASER